MVAGWCPHRHMIYRAHCSHGLCQYGWLKKSAAVHYRQVCKATVLKGRKMLGIPINNKANRKVWMDSALFNDWLLGFDQQMAAEIAKF